MFRIIFMLSLAVLLLTATNASTVTEESVSNLSKNSLAIRNRSFYRRCIRRGRRCRPSRRNRCCRGLRCRRGRRGRRGFGGRFGRCIRRRGSIPSVSASVSASPSASPSISASPSASPSMTSSVSPTPSSSPILCDLLGDTEDLATCRCLWEDPSISFTTFDELREATTPCGFTSSGNPDTGVGVQLQVPLCRATCSGSRMVTVFGALDLSIRGAAPENCVAALARLIFPEFELGGTCEELSERFPFPLPFRIRRGVIVAPEILDNAGSICGHDFSANTFVADVFVAGPIESEAANACA